MDTTETKFSAAFDNESDTAVIIALLASLTEAMKRKIVTWPILSLVMSELDNKAYDLAALEELKKRLVPGEFPEHLVN